MPAAPSPERRLRLLAWNAVPFLQVVVAALLLGGPWLGWSVRLPAVGVWIFVVPPLACRLLASRRSVPQGEVAYGSDDFFVWWGTSCLQGLFNRLPVLEEGLRLVPGLYSAWLRLWGARIGRSTYWAPGVTILDRPFLELGERVVVGVGAKLSSHLLVRDPEGGLRLQVASIRVGDRAIVGGYSVLAPGSEIAPDEATGACQVLPPFNRWEKGRRRRA